MGVSRLDFVKQVLCMSLPVLLPNRTFQVHLICYSSVFLPQHLPQPEIWELLHPIIPAWGNLQLLSATMSLTNYSFPVHTVTLLIGLRFCPKRGNEMCRYFVVWMKGKYMCMINRKDDYAIFLILSCHQCPLCVCANKSVAKGQIRASPGRENAPQPHSFDPPFIQASASQCTLPLGSAFLPFGSLFST